MNFKDKVVIVTGASTGVGAATAVAFTREGAYVVMIGRKQHRLDEVRAKCEAVGKPPLVINVDLTEDDAPLQIVNTTIDRFGKIDILVNNAAILRDGTLTGDTLLYTYDEIMNTNIRAIVFLTTHAVPHIIASKGNIINISTTEAERVNCEGYTTYCVSKAALNHFTKAAAMELGPHGVRVNTVSPSLVRSDLRRNMRWIDRNEDYDEPEPLTTEPEEVASLIKFLASDKAKGITGSNYIIDKG